MQLQTFLSASALALTANALLVPPSVDAKDTEFWDSARGIMIAESHKSLNLPCAGCPLVLKNEDGSISGWMKGEKTDLQMEFTVEGKQIALNGVPFYPPTRQNVALPKHVKQVPADEGAVWVDSKTIGGEVVVSTSIDIHEKMELATVHMGDLVKGDNPVTKTQMRRVSFEILGLADQVVRLDTVEILISESDDNLRIFNVNTTPYTKHSTPEGDACTTVLCRVRATIKQHFSAWRSKLSSAKASCMQKIQRICGAFRLPAPRPHSGINRPKLHGGIPKFSGDATLAPGGKNHPHGPFPHKHHGHHHGHRHGLKHAMHMVGRFMRHVVLPIFIGIAAGMAVSGIGMLIGQAAVTLFMRRRAGGYQSVEQTEQEAGARASFEELPKYEEAPVYEEAPAYADEKREAEN